MRRNDKAIKDFIEIEDIIKRAIVCRVALSDNKIPYIVPVNFGYKNQILFFHCAREGRKIDIIRQNSNVCVEFDIDHDLSVTDTACEWSFKYRSVIGFGKAEIIDNLEEKRAALDIIMNHYSNQNYQYKDEKIKNILIVKITLDTLTGKKSGY